MNANSVKRKFMDKIDTPYNEYKKFKNISDGKDVSINKNPKLNVKCNFDEPVENYGQFILTENIYNYNSNNNNDINLTNFKFSPNKRFEKSY